MADLTQDQLKQIKDQLEPLLGEGVSTNDMTETLLRLLGMPDDQFSVLAPGVIQSYQQSVNNPTDKLALVQAFNATGTKAEDLSEMFKTLVDELDKSSLPIVKRDFLKEIIGTLVNAVNDAEGISKRNVAIPIELCHEDAKIPQYAHITDSGADVYALEDITIRPGETVLVPTGIKAAIPPGYEIQVRPKSGRALKTKLRIANTPGTIDQGYRDEIKVIIENVEPPIKDIQVRDIVNDDGTLHHLEIASIEYGSDYYIGKGEKFCQLVLMEVPKMSFYRVDSVNEIGENRGGGFGSTGLK